MASKTEITALDLRFLVPELKVLIDGRFRKIYQYREKQFLFEIFKAGLGGLWLYADPSKMFLTRHKKPVPKEPPSFCMFLRKHLMGKRIRDVKQHDFDRIVEISTDDNILIFELFSRGNVILCDGSYNIVMPCEFQRWRGREVKPKIPYKYPPKPLNPFELDAEDVSRIIRTDKKIIVLLSVNFGFGSIYGAEVCLRAGIDGDKIGQELRHQEMLKLYETIQSLGREMPSPCVYEDFVSPFPLQTYEAKPQTSPDFSRALDDFFREQDVEVKKVEAEKVVEEKEERIERILDQQKEAGEKWERIEKESREAAEAIYSYYTTVQGVLEGIRKARDSGMGWEEIKGRIKKEETLEAEAIKEIREKDGIVVLDLGGKEIEIDIRKSVEENAEKYFEDAKWAKKKLVGLEGAKEAVLEKAETEPEEEKAEEKPEQKIRKRWYERFKWFISSDGFLVIAGKNARQNESVINKHSEPKDLVFHADIPGAAFVVVQTKGKEVPDETKREAAEFSAANSKAWSRGLGTIDIFSVHREQISKPGHLPQGSFVVTGEREWYRNMELKLSVGVKIEREKDFAKVLSGPVMSMRRNADYFITIKPGFKKSLELSRDIKNKILIRAKPEDKYLIEKIPLEEFEGVIPSGMGEIVEYG